MNKEERLRKTQISRSEITRNLLFQYILSLIGFFIALILFIFLAWRLCRHFIWQPSNPLYRILAFLQEYILAVGGMAFLIGWAGITYYFLAKPMRYIDEIISASEQLAHPTEASIKLPVAIKRIEDELNLVREQALRNALIAKEAEQRKNDLIIYLAHDLRHP